MSTSVKIKTGGQDGSSSKGKIEFSVNKNKIGSSSSSSSTKPAADSKLKSVQTVTKTEVKTTKVKTTKVTTKRVKKVFSLAGQKFDPPEEREPLRIFYESLSKQIPSSEMAEFWMMEHGLLSPERSRKAFERKQRKQKQIRSGVPIKSPPLRSPPLRSPPPRPVSKPQNKPESSQRQQQVSRNGDVKAKKRVVDESDDEDDFVLSSRKRRG